MGKTLIIAEKPSVARDIASALGGFTKQKDWLESPTAIVSSGIGHLVGIDVPEAKEGGRDLDSLPIIPKQFSLVTIPNTKAQFNVLKALMKRADVDCVVNACDAGREGELIFRLIYEHAGCKKPMKRMWLQSMTADSIREAWQKKEPGEKYNNLSDAAKCRSEADWIVGINGSRAVSRLRRSAMSAGRVQTPTLAILVHRELEIQNFVPKDFWEIHGTFAAEAGFYTGKWFRGAAKTTDDEDAGSRFNDRASADAIVAKCRGANPSSVKDESKRSSSAAPKLFDLTTLQREANKRFKFAAKRTLDIAQALYEKHKATTYPRTDSTALPEDYVEKAREVVKTFVGTDYKHHAERVLTNGWVKMDKRIFDNSKISDHFAIIPTGSRPSGLSADESKIYDLVVRRFLAAFHPAAIFNITTRITTVAEETFKSSGKVLIEEGWLAVYGQDANDKTPVLTPVKAGEQVRTEKIEAVAMQTKPPARYTEASLLGAMEGAGKFVEDDELRSAMKERGLGTPATRAATIETLLNDKDGKGRHKEPYVTREGKQQHLVPTGKGIGLVQFLEENGIHALTSPATTGEWEQKLRMMEKGKAKRPEFMQEIAQMTRDMISAMRSGGGSSSFAAPEGGKETKYACPSCGKPITASSRTMDCSGGCGFKLWLTVAGKALSEAEAGMLLTQKVTPVLQGFISKKNKKFSAALKLNEEGKVEFVFEDNGGGTAETLPNTKCPNCRGPILIRKGNYPSYGCEKKCITLWKGLAGREFSDQEAAQLITYGKIEKLEGFVSKQKKKFSAALTMDAAGKVSFVFEDRK
jgi:DNA topoisomerase-3